MASSTPYWMMGLSTIGSISLGCALVAGRKRVPSPAAGNTALRTLMGMAAGFFRGRALFVALKRLHHNSSTAAIPEATIHRFQARYACIGRARKEKAAPDRGSLCRKLQHLLQ